MINGLTRQPPPPHPHQTSYDVLSPRPPVCHSIDFFRSHFSPRHLREHRDGACCRVLCVLLRDRGAVRASVVGWQRGKICSPGPARPIFRSVVLHYDGLVAPFRHFGVLAAKGQRYVGASVNSTDIYFFYVLQSDIYFLHVLQSSNERNCWQSHPKRTSFVFDGFFLSSWSVLSFLPLVFCFVLYPSRRIITRKCVCVTPLYTR